MSKNHRQSILLKHEQITSGPILSPDVLVKYESIRPGITEIFLQTYQHQVNHRIESETNAKYEGELEIPVIKGIKKTPNKLISFIDAMKSSTKDFN